MMSPWQTMFIYVLLLSWSSEVVLQTLPPVTNDATNNVADLMLMIDCSFYITESNFSILLQSVANFIETLPLGPSAVHVAAMSYSNVVDRSDFTSNKTLAQLDVLSRFFDGQSALTHLAFDVVYTVMTARHSLRPEAKKIVILFTESFARYPTDSRQSAEKLLGSDVEVWAVGIGPYIRQLELLSYTRNLTRIILWDRFDVLPPIPLGFSSSVLPTEVASTTNATTATLRIEPSTTSNVISTSEETVKSTTTSTASPAITATQMMTSTTATTATSETLTSTAAISTSTVVSTNISLVSTATDMASSASRYIDATSFLNEVSATTHTTTTSRTPVITDFTISTMASVSSATVHTTPSSLSVISTDSMSGSMVSHATTIATSRLIYSSDASLVPTAVNPSLTPTSMLPYLTPTDDVLSLTSLPVNPTLSMHITLAPTPTQTDLLVSSTRVVEDPGSNTTTDHILDDGSVVFNSSDKDGLCYKAVASKGYGFVPHPRDCDKFLQCYRSERGSVTASVRLCPRGQFWKQANLTCVSPGQACCRDPCEKNCDGQTFRMDGGCGRYWECSQGMSMAKRCPLFHAYIPGTGCVFMSTCVDADKSSGSCQYSGICDALPLSENSGYRIQTFSGPFDFTCLGSTEFQLASCTCRPLKRLSTCCNLVTLLNTMSQVVADTSLVNRAMVQAGCTPNQISDNQTKTSTTKCNSDQSPSSDPMRDVTLHFQYLTTTSPRSLPQVLVRSSACVPERGGILVVSEDTSFLDVKVISSTGYVITASLPLYALNKTAWWDVHVQYNRGDVFLQLTVEDLVYNVYAKGGPHVPVGACGWRVGEPEELSDHLSKLAGKITDVLVSRCNEYGF